MKILASLAILLPAMLLPVEKSQTSAIPPAPQTSGQPSGSDQVPDVYAIPAHPDSMVVLRLKFDTDLLAGIQRMVKEQNIRNGIIVSGIGSVRGYQIDQASTHDLPSKNTVESNPNTPAELVGMNGYIIDGRVHAHVTLATPDKAIAGHLQLNTRVLTCAIVTIVVANDANFARIDDQTYR
jgi:predicted DNA-binding protein with PD1-like motif